MAILPLPGGGGWYDEDTMEILDYGGSPASEATAATVAQITLNRAEGFYGSDSPTPLPRPMAPMGPFHGFEKHIERGRIVELPGGGYLTPLAGGIGGLGAAAATVGTAIKMSEIAAGAARSVLFRAFAGARRNVVNLWSRMTPVQQQAVTGVGAAAGTSFIMDELTDDPGGPDLAALAGVVTGNGGANGFPTIVKTWTSNGMQFGRLSDGRNFAVKLDGTITFWRPKRPIVIFRGGAGDLRTFLKADGALNRQAKKLSKALARRAPRRRAPRPTSRQEPTLVRKIEVE
jgi:hypothetical protein